MRCISEICGLIPIDFAANRYLLAMNTQWQRQVVKPRNDEWKRASFFRIPLIKSPDKALICLMSSDGA